MKHCILLIPSMCAAPNPLLQVTKDLYKRARKLRRASDAIMPLLEAAHEDLEYVEQVGGNDAWMSPDF